MHLGLVADIVVLGTEWQISVSGDKIPHPNLGYASTGICDIVSPLTEICHSGTDTSNIFYYSQVFSGLIEFITTLWEGQGNPNRVFKTCNPRRGLPSRECYKSWTHGDGIPESLPQRGVWLFFSYLLNV